MGAFDHDTALTLQQDGHWAVAPGEGQLVAISRQTAKIRLPKAD